MHISESGRVVLVDDKRDEIEPILTLLARNGIPYMYFDGKSDALPVEPFVGIRFVFLDIELQGMAGQDPKTKASAVVGVLKKIISKDNGPYVIGFWTQHKEVIPYVIENCKMAGIPPVKFIDLEKAVDMPHISERLNQNLEQIGAFQLYVEWENVVNDASKEFVRAFSSLVDFGDNWSKDTAALFYKLYKTYVEENEITDRDEQFKCACHLMNRSFLDTLEFITRRDLKLPESFNLDSGAITSQTIAKVNHSLFLGEGITNRHNPGNVYIHENEILKKALVKNIYKDGQCPECILCSIIISPECDLAHNKMVSFGEAGDTPIVAHRVLYGLLTGVTPTNKFNSIGKDGRFVIGPIWYDKTERELVIHLGTVSFLAENAFIASSIFSLKRDLLFDLQSKCANHVNRLGNFLLS
jgi:hypothetical protein